MSGDNLKVGLSKLLKSSDYTSSKLFIFSLLFLLSRITMETIPIAMQAKKIPLAIKGVWVSAINAIQSRANAMKFKNATERCEETPNLTNLW